jgi:alkanesulfonate monooxygenase SsuD/methylene tetrahydromethanopterin reductase-like flavin-dependent oxidoreductase (luciferase family)
LIGISNSGLMLEPQLGMSMEGLVDASRLAEELDFGYVFRSDHLLPTDDSRGVDSPECWTSLGAIAAATSRVKFGPMVSPVGFRNPALLAKMACTLHSFSRGRLQLAIGAGWYAPEYAAHGIPFPSFRERVSQFREGSAIISDMVRRGRVDFDGKHFSAHTDCLPRPSGRLWMIVGAKSNPVVRVAAKIADEWNFLASPIESFLAAKAWLDEAREGRPVEISEMGPFLIGKDESDLEANAAAHVEKRGLQLSPPELVKRVRDRNGNCGVVEDFVGQLRMKADAGISRFYFQTLVPENRGMLELLADTMKSGL